MPVASSSRRKVLSRNKQLSTDQIEDDVFSQGRARNEDLDDEDEDEVAQPKRPVKTVKKEKKPTVTKGKGKTRAEPAVDEEEDDEMDFENFGDQALIKGDAAKLKGLASDWAQIRTAIHEPSFGQLQDIATHISDTAEGEERDKWLSELDKIMRDLIDVQKEMKAHEESVNDIYQKLMQGEQITDAVERYNTGVEAKATEYRKSTTRRKYAKHDAYIKFRQGIHEVLHPDQPMPPVTSFISKEDGDDSEDDDVEVGGVTQDYKCPITLTTLVDPMTAPCGHSFSAEAIRSFFKGARQKKCPGAGCSRVYAIADLKADKELAKKIKLAARRAGSSDEESDAEEVIE